MEETNYCQYIDTICIGQECSQCSTYFKHKNEQELKYRLKKLREGTLTIEDKIKLKLAV